MQSCINDTFLKVSPQILDPCTTKCATKAQGVGTLANPRQERVIIASWNDVFELFCEGPVSPSAACVLYKTPLAQVVLTKGLSGRFLLSNTALSDQPRFAISLFVTRSFLHSLSFPLCEDTILLSILIVEDIEARYIISVTSWSP